MKVYRGIVVDNKDPDKNFKVKVRIKGLHNDSVSADNLVWSEVISSTTFGLNQGVGISSVLQVGTWVWVFLEDDNPNRPIVFGVVTGNGDSETSLQDDNAYGSTQVIKTKSGHFISLGDVEGQTSITIHHTSGSEIKMDNDGNIFVTCKKDAQYTVEGNTTWEIKGSLTVKSNGASFDTPNASFTGNVDISKVSTASDHLSSGKSGKSHTHTAPHGETTPPH